MGSQRGHAHCELPELPMGAGIETHCSSVLHAWGHELRQTKTPGKSRGKRLVPNRGQ